MTTNMLASSTEGGAVLDPPPGRDRRPRLRGVAGRLDHRLGRPRGRRHALGRADAVDVFVTTTVVRPRRRAHGGKYMSDRSTKITYQDVMILARKDQFYVIRAPVAVAEEIAHLQATGVATFSLALRPLEDQRQVDATLARRDHQPGSSRSTACRSRSRCCPGSRPSRPRRRGRPPARPPSGRPSTRPPRRLPCRPPRPHEPGAPVQHPMTSCCRRAVRTDHA